MARNSGSEGNKTPVINDSQKAYLRGLQYEREKKKVTNPYGVAGKKDGGDNTHQLKTSERLAEIHKVDERTIREDVSVSYGAKSGKS